MAKSNEQLTPVNGYLTFDPGVSQGIVTIRTVDDDVAEEDKTYTAVLYSPKGGARLDTNNDIMSLKGIILFNKRL